MDSCLGRAKAVNRFARYRMLHLLTTLALAGTAVASYAGNLNYRSPSWNHPSLGVSIHKVNKRNAGAAPYPASKLNFTHGVASGDPYPDSVIIWTRCAPMFDDDKSNTTVSGYVPLYNPVPIYDDKNGTAVSTAPICVSFKIATDKGLKNVADSGRAYTSSDVDYTLKVGEITHFCLNHQYLGNICLANPRKGGLGIHDRVAINPSSFLIITSSATRRTLG